MDSTFIFTVKQSDKELCRNGLMYRYGNEDDSGKPSNVFTVCLFAMAKATD